MISFAQATGAFATMFLCMAIPGCATSGATAEVGWRQIEMRDYPQALATFDQAMAHGETAELHAGRAQALFSMQQHRAAESAYGRALAMDPNQAQWYIDLAIVQISAGALEQAIRSCDHALEIESHLPRAYYNRGFAHQLNRDLDDALSDFTQSIEIDPGLAVAYNSRGIILAELGSFEPALQDFRHALKLTPQLASAYANAAAANYAMGRAELAFIDLNAAIKIERKNPLFYKNRGRMYLDHSNVVQAMEDFGQALLFAPEDRNLWQLMAEARRLQGEMGHP